MNVYDRLSPSDATTHSDKTLMCPPTSNGSSPLKLCYVLLSFAPGPLLTFPELDIRRSASGLTRSYWPVAGGIAHLLLQLRARWDGRTQYCEH